MMKFKFSLLFPFAYGMALAAVGFNALTWQFWLLIILVAAWVAAGIQEGS